MAEMNWEWKQNGNYNNYNIYITTYTCELDHIIQIHGNTYSYTKYFHYMHYIMYIVLYWAIITRHTEVYEQTEEQKSKNKKR